MHYYKDIERRCELSIATSRLNLERNGTHGFILLWRVLWGRRFPISLGRRAAGAAKTTLLSGRTSGGPLAQRGF